jgi:hypothetical protein
MASQRKPIKLTWKKGLLLFAACFAVTVAVVFVLRQVLIPKEELDCYARVITLQKAVHQWDQVHPDKPLKDDIDEAALVKEGFLQPLVYDHNLHYYFVGETAHGLRVKCNKHEDNPLVLRLTGDFLLAVLVFVVLSSFRGYVLFDPS